MNDPNSQEKIRCEPDVKVLTINAIDAFPRHNLNRKTSPVETEEV